MSLVVSNRQSYYPPISDTPTPAEMATHLKNLYTAINDHDQAIVKVGDSVKVAADAEAAAATSAANTSSSNTTPSEVTAAATAAVTSLLGTVNQQPSDYTVQTSDYGGVVYLTPTAAGVVTLNPLLAPQWFSTLANNGTATLTLTPGTSVGVTGTINNDPTLDLTPDSFATIFFDGINWWAVVGATGSGSADHFIATGGTPLANAGPDSGTGATVAITGADAAGIISLTAGTGGGNGIVVNTTFAIPYANQTVVVLTAGSASSAPLPMFANSDTSGFSINIIGALTAGTIYVWNYVVLGL